MGPKREAEGIVLSQDPIGSDSPVNTQTDRLKTLPFCKLRVRAVIMTVIFLCHYKLSVASYYLNLTEMALHYCKYQQLLVKSLDITSVIMSKMRIFYP